MAEVRSRVAGARLMLREAEELAAHAQTLVRAARVNLEQAEREEARASREAATVRELRPNDGGGDERA